jgi:serine O-acetyltransferase
MIQNKEDLREYLSAEKGLYFGGEKSSFLEAFLLRSKNYRIWQYLHILRLAEYHKNQHSVWHKIAFVWFHHRKYVVGHKLGFEIPENCVKKGLMIYHIAPIVINEDAKMGEFCCIVGNFCLGNTGAGTSSPVLGNKVTAGWGSCVIGEVKVADEVVIGAGCVLTHSVDRKGAKVLGVPGRVNNKEQG